MKARWKIIFALVALVLVSVLVGAYAGSKLTRKAMLKRGAPENWNVSAMRAVERRLKLSPEQKRTVQTIMDRRVEELKAIRDETVTKTNVVLDQLIAEVDRELDAKQRVEFDKMKRDRAQSTLEVLKLEPTKK